MGGHTLVWEYRVKPDRRAEFERRYGPSGDWVKLFRRAPGFIETILLREDSESCRYVTFDRWQRVEHYREFLKRFSREYRELDDQCAELTTEEKALGEFAECIG